MTMATADLAMTDKAVPTATLPAGRAKAAGTASGLLVLPSTFS